MATSSSKGAQSYQVKVDGVSYNVEVAEGGAATKIEPSTIEPSAQEKSGSKEPTTQSRGGEEVKAFAPGNILKIMVELGQEVKEGDTLLIMEAMKMESPVSAPCDGKIGNIAVSAGATVQTGELLLTIE